MPRLWIARHAAPLIAKGTCYGQLNVAADAEATLRAAQLLAKQLPEHLVAHHSPLQRCEQLSLALKVLRPDLASSPDLRLMEMDFGTWEGLAWDQIPAPALQAWTNQFASHAPGDGETVQAFMGRVAAALDEVRRNGHDSLWISHAGVARAAALLAAGRQHITHAHEWPQEGPGFGQYILLQLG